VSDEPRELKPVTSEEERLLTPPSADHIREFVESTDLAQVPPEQMLPVIAEAGLNVESVLSGFRAFLEAIHEGDPRIYPSFYWVNQAQIRPVETIAHWRVLARVMLHAHDLVLAAYPWLPDLAATLDDSKTSMWTEQFRRLFLPSEQTLYDKHCGLIIPLAFEVGDRSRFLERLCHRLGYKTFLDALPFKCDGSDDAQETANALSGLEQTQTTTTAVATPSAPLVLKIDNGKYCVAVLDRTGVVRGSCDEHTKTEYLLLEVLVADHIAHGDTSGLTAEALVEAAGLLGARVASSLGDAIAKFKMLARVIERPGPGRKPGGKKAVYRMKWMTD